MKSEKVRPMKRLVPKINKKISIFQDWNNGTTFNECEGMRHGDDPSFAISGVMYVGL